MYVGQAVAIAAGTPGTSITALEGGNSAYHQTTLTFTNVAVALTDVAATVAYLGKKIYTFPQGFIRMDGAVANLAITKSSAGVNDDWDGDFGIGTVTASNNNSLASTEQNVIPTTPTPQASNGATTARGVSTGTEAGVIHDGHTTPIDFYLNVLVDDGDQDVTGTPCNLIFNGTITITWQRLGDY